MHTTIHKALEALRPSLKREYLEALSTVPELVQLESPKIRFLLREAFHPFQAAMRLTRYWKYRKQYFGERWLLPMNQTGTGALSMDDIEIIRTGYLVYFEKDNLILMDVSRLPVINDSIERANFYWAQAFGQYQSAQNDAMSVLHVVSSDPRPLPNVQSEAWKVMLTALPVHNANVRVAQSYEKDRQTLVDFLSFQTAKFVSLTSGKHVERVATGSTESNLLALQEYGFRRELLPPRLGGTYDYSQYHQWVRMRISVEEIMSAAHPVRNSALWWKETDNARPTTTAIVPRTRPAARNSVYCKRYYDKRKDEKEAVYQEHDSLVAQQEDLRKEQKRLEDLLARAERLVTASLDQP
jgi:hypothetical protein